VSASRDDRPEQRQHPDEHRDRSQRLLRRLPRRARDSHLGGARLSRPERVASPRRRKPMIKLFALCVSLAACSLPDPNAVTEVTGPDLGQFASVQPFMDKSCGSLDCHGVRYRNLKIYGYDGLRLAPGDVPGGNPTTTAEVDATYDSVVFL